MNVEEIKKAEEAHFKFGLEMYFSGSKKIDGATLLFSDTITDIYWNYATQLNFPEEKTKKTIEEISRFYKSINRTPAVYYTPATNPKNLPTALIESGFALKAKEAWMFWQGVNPKIKKTFDFRETRTKEDAEEFATIFKRAYGGATPDEPYGALPPCYAEAVYKIAQNPRTKNYLVKIDEEPVGMATLVHNNEFAGIYCVGTVPECRGKGIGAFLSLKLVGDALKQGINRIFLQTEAGSFNERFYDWLGFKTEFIAEQYVLE